MLIDEAVSEARGGTTANDPNSDIDDLVREVGYRPATRIEEGVQRFVDWFCDYYGYQR